VLPCVMGLAEPLQDMVSSTLLNEHVLRNIDEPPLPVSSPTTMSESALVVNKRFWSNFDSDARVAIGVFENEKELNVGIEETDWS
jgi:hypothetical protein